MCVKAGTGHYTGKQVANHPQSEPTFASEQPTIDRGKRGLLGVLVNIIDCEAIVEKIVAHARDRPY